MKSKFDKDILEKYKHHQLEETDEKKVDSMLAEGETNTELRKYVKADFDDYLSKEQQNLADVGYILDRVHHKINNQRSIIEIKPISRFVRWYSRVAAILLIPLFVAGGVKLYMDYEEGLILSSQQLMTAKVSAPLGSRVSFILPDGTKGYLNSGSSIEYQEPFSTNRIVKISGEAWFDVTHDADHPFEVMSGKSKVKVLGTQFNCNAIPEEQYMEVILEEGKVEFSTSGLKKNIIMKPDERLVLQSNILNITEVNASKYTAWKEGKLVFKSDAMKEVVRRMERWYNIDIEVKDKELEEYVFRGTFQDDTFEEVLKYLSITSPIKYKIIDRELQNDGTVTKKKVLLYKE